MRPERCTRRWAAAMDTAVKARSWRIRQQARRLAGEGGGGGGPVCGGGGRGGEGPPFGGGGGADDRACAPQGCDGPPSELHWQENWRASGARHQVALLPAPTRIRAVAVLETWLRSLPPDDRKLFRCRRHLDRPSSRGPSPRAHRRMGFRKARMQWRPCCPQAAHCHDRGLLRWRVEHPGPERAREHLTRSSELLARHTSSAIPDGGNARLCSAPMKTASSPTGDLMR